MVCYEDYCKIYDTTILEETGITSTRLYSVFLNLKADPRYDESFECTKTEPLPENFCAKAFILKSNLIMLSVSH